MSFRGNRIDFGDKKRAIFEKALSFFDGNSISLDFGQNFLGKDRFGPIFFKNLNLRLTIEVAFFITFPTFSTTVPLEYFYGSKI